MKIAIVGSGKIGSNVGLRAAEAGHEVYFTFSRDPQKLKGLACLGGENAYAHAVEPSILMADVIVFAVPWALRDMAIRNPSAIAGKVLIDATNQFTSDGLIDLGGETAVSQTIKRFDQSIVTKAFNTLTAGFQAGEITRPKKFQHAMFYAGENAHGLAVTSELIRVVGFEPVCLCGWEEVSMMEAPRRRGAVYGEAYLPPDARQIAELLKTDPEAAQQLAIKLKRPE